MKPPEQDCGEEGELQVREGSFIESIRIVCSNLFRNYHQSEGQEGGLTGTGGENITPATHIQPLQSLQSKYGQNNSLCLDLLHFVK